MSNKLHIKMGPIEFEIEGDSDLIERERIQFFTMLPQAISAVSPVVPVPSHVVEPEVEVNDQPALLLGAEEENNSSVVKNYESLAEFLREKKFSTGVETVMGVAYFLQYNRSYDAITSRDIEQALDDERQNKPGNIPQMLIQNIKKGYLRELKEKKNGRKAYCVLERGKNWCERYAPAASDPKKKATKNKTSKPAVESSLLSISVDELNRDKYCDIALLPKFNEQMLVLMLMYTREKGIEYFSFNDIASVMKTKFKIPATERKVRYAFDNGGTMFDKKVEKKVAYHRLMQDGIKEAERIVAEQRADSSAQTTA